MTTRSMATEGGGFFGVLVDPYTYGSLFYMVLSLATGVFYFTWAITGLALTAGLMILIIGIPFALLFLGSVRGIGWAEARITEALLGAQISAAPPAAPTQGFWGAVKAALADPRTWGTLIYMILMLPLGILYFTLAVTFGATSVALVGGGAFSLVSGGPILHGNIEISDPWLSDLVTFANSPSGEIAAVIFGALLLFLTLHLARGIGWMHARIAEALLVR